MPSRGQSITLSYVAWDNSANVGKSGDAANHTLRWVKDGTSAAPANSPSEVDATNAPGLYKLTLTATECTCDFGTLCGKSSTANIVVLPISVAFEQLPTVAAGAASGLPTLDGAQHLLVYSVSQPVTAGTVTDKIGYSLAASGLDAITVESGVNARQVLSPILAGAAGVIAGIAGTGPGTAILKTPDGTVTRATISYDGAGNRTGVTLNLPA